MIYLAAPLFSKADQTYGWRLLERLEQLGHIVYYPWRDAGDKFYKRLYSRPSQWLKAVYAENVRALTRADSILAIADGADVDSGVAWELGYAKALGKEIVLLRTDFRAHTANGLTVNLMIARSASREFHAERDLLSYYDRRPRYQILVENIPYRFYDRVVTEYDDERLHPRTQFIRREAQVLALSMLTGRKCQRALDLGGGSSNFLDAAACASGVVLDPSRQLLAARRDHGSVAQVVGDLKTFDINSCRFDLVTAVLSMDHVFDLQGALMSIRALLTPGGHAIFVYQKPETEERFRDRPAYFSFDSSKLRTRFFVRSRIHQLRQFPNLLADSFTIEAVRESQIRLWKVSPLVGIRCRVA